MKSGWRSLLGVANGAGGPGFVGLVIPPMLRLSGLTNQHYLLPDSALTRAGVLFATH